MYRVLSAKDNVLNTIKERITGSTHPVVAYKFHATAEKMKSSAPASISTFFIE